MLSTAQPSPPRPGAHGSVLGDPVEIRMDGVAEHGERDEGLALKKRAAKVPAQAP